MKKTLLTLIFLFSLNIGFSQKLIWTSGFGGANSNGAVVSYDFGNTNLSNEFDLPGNPLGVFNFFSNNYSGVTDYQDYERETNGLFAASNGYIYGVDHNVGFNSSKLGIDGGILYRFDPNAATPVIEVLHVFKNERYWINESFTNNSLEYGLSKPRFGLTEANGVLYGMCIKGGEENRGGVWSFDINTGVYSELKDFTSGPNDIGYNPTGPMILGPDDDLYFTLGISRSSAANGALIRIQVSTGTVLYHCSLNNAGVAISNPNGRLIYEPSTQRFYGAKRFDFPPSGGGIYTYTFASASNDEPNLNVDNRVGIFNDTQLLGSNVEGMIEGNDGKEYAVTTSGGAAGKGTLLLYSQTNSSLIKIKDFSYSPNGNSLFADGTKIWGTYVESYEDPVDFNLWSYDLASGVLDNHIPTTQYKGVEPQLAFANNSIYMRMIADEGNNSGDIVVFDMQNSTFNVEIEGNSALGKTPVGSLLDIGNGQFLGFTRGCAPNLNYSNHEGNIVKYDLVAGTGTHLKTIEAVDASIISSTKTGPMADNCSEMILAGNNKVYFTSISHGIPGLAVVPAYEDRKVLWEFDPATNDLNIVDNISGGVFGDDGSPTEIAPGKIAYSAVDDFHVYNYNTQTVSAFNDILNIDLNGVLGGQVTLAANGKLYGTTKRPVDNDVNAKVTLFEIDPSNNYALTSLYEFDSAIIQTNTVLTEYNGKLYGSTSSGGTNDHGYLFSYPLTGGNITIEYSFDSSQDGANFDGKWTLKDDTLYAISLSGGTNGNGTLLSYNLLNNQPDVLENLNMSNGNGYLSTPIFWDDTALSINESELDLGLSIYPNPTNSIISINSSKVNSIQIINVNGQIIKTNKNQNNITVEDLNTGIYFIKVQVENKLSTFKFIKN